MEVEKMNVYQKLHQVMSNVKKVSQDEASKIPYKIVTWNTVHGAIKDALKKARLVLIPICTSQEEIGNMSKDKPQIRSDYNKSMSLKRDYEERSGLQRKQQIQSFRDIM